MGAQEWPQGRREGSHSGHRARGLQRQAL